MESKKRILIVDDETKIVEVIAAYMESNGYITSVAYDGEAALSMFEKIHPDLVVLDLMLPKKSGEEVCKAIRRISRVPIIMLTAKIDEDHKIDGFHMGADDYVTKPFSPRELVARVNSILRRTSDSTALLYRSMSWNEEDLEIDFEGHVVKKAGSKISLTPNEFKLLSTLIRFPKKTFTREELIDIALNADYEGFERTIDSHIKNLRSKIEDDSANPQYIITVRGVGYKFGGIQK